MPSPKHIIISHKKFRVLIQCNNCYKVQWICKNQLKRGAGKFCSKKCVYEYSYNKGLERYSKELKKTIAVICNVCHGTGFFLDVKEFMPKVGTLYYNDCLFCEGGEV